jgi:hypothetical protein
MVPTSPGVWIALDGLDASGKSEQVPLVAARLREAGISPIVEIPEFSVAQGYFCDPHMQELRIRHIPRQHSLVTSHDTYTCIY